MDALLKKSKKPHIEVIDINTGGDNEEPSLHFEVNDAFLDMIKEEKGIDRVFHSIFQASQKCRFNDCTHKAEPHCAIQKAVSEGHIHHEKLERYQRLVEEASEQTEIRNRQNRKLR